MKPNIAIVQSIHDAAVREINALEQRIVKSEDDAEAQLWEQARQVVERLGVGMTQRQLAKQWINARTGEPYSYTHVQFTVKAFDKFTCHPRPRFRDAYNDVANNRKTKSSPVYEEMSGIVQGLDGLISGGVKFGTIYADPPWKYGNQGTRSATDTVYPTMTVDEICALPVESVAHEESHLHLWTTNAFLFEAKRVMDAWGFQYKSCLVWVKPQMGIGNYWRVSHEFLLLGTRGGAKFLNRAQKSWVEANRTTHSAKPPAVRSIIEKVSPAPRLEMFGRSEMHNWVVLGNQVRRSLVDIRL